MTQIAEVALIENEMAKQDSTTAQQFFAEDLSLIMRRRGRTQHQSAMSQLLDQGVPDKPAEYMLEGTSDPTLQTKQKTIPPPTSETDAGVRNPGNGAAIDVYTADNDVHSAVARAGQNPGNGDSPYSNSEDHVHMSENDKVQMIEAAQRGADSKSILECLLRRISELESKYHEPRSGLERPGLAQLRAENRRFKHSQRRRFIDRTRHTLAARNSSFRDGTLSRRPVYQPVRVDAASSEQIQASGTPLPATTCWRTTARRGFNASITSTRLQMYTLLGTSCEPKTKIQPDEWSTCKLLGCQHDTINYSRP